MSYDRPKKQGKVVPWSYSSLNAYEQCPRRYHLTRITKVVTESQSVAMTHGNEVHKALEHAVAGSVPLPEKYALYGPIVDRLRAAPGRKLLEYKFGLTSALNECDYWGSDVWVRGQIDVGIVKEKSAIVLDYKTGKRKMDGDQLRLFTLAALSLWPQINTVKTGYIWLQSGSMDQEKFTRAQKAEIHEDFARRVHRMEVSERSGDWPARPSGLCREWCPVGKSLCEHCGRP